MGTWSALNQSKGTECRASGADFSGRYYIIITCLLVLGGPLKTLSFLRLMPGWRYWLSGHDLVDSGIMC